MACNKNCNDYILKRIEAYYGLMTFWPHTINSGDISSFVQRIVVSSK